MSNHYKLLVKFKPDSIASVKDGKVYFGDSDWIQNHANFIFNFNYRIAIPGLAKDGNIHSTENNIDFSQYKGLLYVETDMDLEKLESLAEDYKHLPIIEYVVLEPAEPIQPPHEESVPPDESVPDISLLSTTPDLTSEQLYLRDNPGNDIYGIDADYPWSLSTSIAGQGIRCADIEWGGNYQHEDLVGSNLIELIPTTDHKHDDHGSAVASIIMARNNGFGMKGAAYNIDNFYAISEIPNGRPAAIAKALENLRSGDVLLYQMQVFGQNNKYIPPDYNQAVWDLTKTATDAGIIVIMPAGNGAENLEDDFYTDYRNRGDNGSIRVGAGTKQGRVRASFSTYSDTMVHVQGWGDNSVAAAGYGTLYNGGEDRTYTNEFSGTSSASAIVASAAILIQSWYKANHTGALLSPRDMRNLLIETGTAQGKTIPGHIGPLPNVKRAIKELQVPEDYPLWVSHIQYKKGDRVSWEGRNWEAKWIMMNVQPGKADWNGGYPWNPLAN